MSIIRSYSPLKVFLTVILFFITYVSFGQGYDDSASISHYKETDPIQKTLKGKKFHDFFVQNESGDKISSKEIKDKTTFINFWFEACAPCVAEFNSLNNLYEKYKANNEFKFISFSFEDDSIIRRVKKDYNLIYPIYHLSRDSCKLLTFGMQGYPSNYILNRKREVVFVGIGGPIDKNRVQLFFRYIYEAYLNKLLNN